MVEQSLQLALAATSAVSADLIARYDSDILATIGCGGPVP